MNGTIRAKIVSGGGLDEHGAPIESNYSWSDACECRYKPNTLSNRGKYIDGTFTQAQYDVTVFDMKFGIAEEVLTSESGMSIKTQDGVEISTFDKKSVSLEVILFDKNGNVICQDIVQSIEYLESVQRVRIIV